MNEQEKEKIKNIVNAIIMQIGEGDLSGVDQLNAIMTPQIVKFILVNCGNVEIAKDVAQKTFITTLRKAREKKVRIDNCPSFMMGIAIRKWKNYKDKYEKETPLMEEYYSDQTSSYEDIYDQINARIMLQRLPNKERQIYVLGYQGYSNKEIGGMMRMSERTVKRKKAFAKNFIKEYGDARFE